MKLRSFIVGLVISFSTVVSASTGQQIFESKCSSCHGVNTDISVAPILHGRKTEYLRKQLNDFKKGKRPDLLMDGQMVAVASELSLEDIGAVTSYLEGLEPCDFPKESADLPGDIEAGRRKAAACLSCHENWNPGLRAPNLFAQRQSYLVHTLGAFKSKSRKNSYTMTSQARRLSKMDMQDIGAFFSSVSVCE
ncbi:MAG: c-type cytochrome [Bdellovibrionaceae bacterium]|jgi:cytochrome c553|nr:c-type cytochrome [Pseudobdellovibrionaceae bacterium]